MQHLGYPFWDHLPTLWTRVKGVTDHDEQVNWPSAVRKDKHPQREPDFVVQQAAAGGFALAESKGHLVSANGFSGSRKNSLNEGLDQIRGWSSFLHPVPIGCYAVSNYFQESNALNEPSLIAYTDPPGKNGEEPEKIAELQPDEVRRGNYGSWLIGMGLEVAGNRLRTRTAFRPRTLSLAILTVHGQRYAVVLNQMLCPCLVEKTYFQNWDEPSSWHINRLLAKILWGALPVIGIREDILRTIERTFTSSDDTRSLMDLPMVPRNAQTEAKQDGKQDQMAVSLFDDGTLFGFVGLKAEFWQEQLTKEFNLGDLDQTT